MRLRVHDEHIRRYLWRYLNSPAARQFLRDRATGTAGNMPKISGKTLKSLPVLMPRDANFQRVNEQIDRAFSWINTVPSDVSKAKSLLEHLDQAVLTKAFRGELVPQDPSDEPATVLLERIQAERLERQNIEKSAASKRRRTKKSTAKTERITMGRKRTEVSESHLSETLQALGGVANAKELWQRSDMDIDEFYKLLRDEIMAGRIKEGTEKERLERADAA